MSPVSWIRLSAVVVCIQLVQACKNPTTTLLFENRSELVIDSVVVYIQQYRMVFRKVLPNTSVSRLILHDSVQNRRNDFTIKARVYAGSLTKQGMYHTRLSSLPDVMYTITHNSSAKLDVHPGSLRLIRY